MHLGRGKQLELFHLCVCVCVCNYDVSLYVEHAGNSGHMPLARRTEKAVQTGTKVLREEVTPLESHSRCGRV